MCVYIFGKIKLKFEIKTGGRSLHATPLFDEFILRPSLNIPAGRAKRKKMDPDALSKAFVEHYYSTFDANRAALAGLYQEASMLTFEGQKIQGAQNITDKLAGLPFQQCQHQITTVDCQPSGPAGGMIVFVSGNLLLAGEQHPLKFSQVFYPFICFDVYVLIMFLNAVFVSFYWNILNAIFRSF